MLVSLSNLLSFLPPLPLLTRQEKPLLPPPPPTLSWRRRRVGEVDDGLGLISINGLHLEAAGPSVLWSKAGYYNVQVVVGEDEPEEVLLRRFKREVSKAGVIQECKRRRWFEDKQAKKKRKAREAARRNRKRRFQPKKPPPDNQEVSNIDKEEEEDNWELPEGELPY